MSKLRTRLIALAAVAAAGVGLGMAPAVAGPCPTETYTEYYSDAARTIWVGERIDTCDGQVLMSGSVGPYHTRTTEECGFCAG